MKTVIAGFLLFALISTQPNADTLIDPVSGKTITGTVTALQAGDRGCYVEFTDTKGEQHTELAYFEVCEQQELLNMEVRFTYARENVMSMACQGDPDCLLTESVWLIDSMRGIESSGE